MQSYNKSGIEGGRFWQSLLLISFFGVLAFAGGLARAQDTPSAVYIAPTNSSPIAISNDKAWVWSVNPDDDSVSIIDAATDTGVFQITVGDEPQSVALDPNGSFAYIANAADGSISVVRVTNTAPFAALVVATLATGAEPWNVVISPDGKRVYVANSAQDTITIIKSDVIYPTLPSILGTVGLRSTACNSADPNRHFQPRGMAVTADNTKLYVTRFLSFVKSGGVQGSNTGKEGLICRLDINTSASTIGGSVTGYTATSLPASDSGFPSGTSEAAYPNQLQSIVLRGSQAYLPNIASAPSAPLNFNSDTQAFVNVVNGALTTTQTPGQVVNLQLGARLPEIGKTRLFFANPWAMAFTNQSGSGTAYVVSAGSDLLAKLLVSPGGTITFTNSISTTRYIDLNDPSNPVTSGRDAGKNPLGIVINTSAVPMKAYVMNYVSRNISVVDLTNDLVIKAINLTNLPVAGTTAEQVQVGKEMFFSSRGNFNRPPGTTVSTQNRLSSEGWQACASCHFAGLTDGNVWVFASGPRRSLPLNGTFSPKYPNEQRMLNYSAIFDEVQDFELNIRNVSGPGPLSAGPPPVLDPAHGLLFDDGGNINAAPGTVAAFSPANSARQQHSLTLPGSNHAWPALDALQAYVRLGIRTPNGALTSAELSAAGGDPSGGLNPSDVALGSSLFLQAGCLACHGGAQWTISQKDFVSPPASAEVAAENPPTATSASTQYLFRFLRDIGSFNLGVAGQGNLIGLNIGAVEKNNGGLDALGKDYNNDGKGAGYTTPSLLGIWASPPYYHNGACETLACVLTDVTHRTRGLLPGQADPLTSGASQAQLVTFLQTLDAGAPFFTRIYLPIANR